MLLDLCWEADWSAAIAGSFARQEVGLVGMTLRNTDDCAFSSRQSFLDEFTGMTAAVRRHTDAPIAVGGVGFSVMPECVLERCGADLGVWGEGEFMLPQLAGRLEAGEPWQDLPQVVWRANDAWRRNPPARFDLARLPPMGRGWIDHRRYFREGGQAGFETKRGCPLECVYCADPLAKGRTIRTRPPAAVADEIERLAAQGIDHLHTCDSEFNLPPQHALAVCREIERRGLGERVRWYAYCSPAPFGTELAETLRRAGCVGINFGADHGDAGMLSRLGRHYTPADIAAATRACREAGITVMLDLLLGGPGESDASLRRMVDFMKQVGADQIGVAVGVRVYPGTPLAHRLLADGAAAGLIGGDDPCDPLFFIEPEVAPFIFPLLDELIGDDPRFLFFDPNRADRNYNYNANDRLVEAIRVGYRGAYWDILRRCAET